MNRKIILLLLLTSPVLRGSLFAQDLSGDQEQKELQEAFDYTKLTGTVPDSSANLALYEVIAGWLGTPYKYSGDCKDGIDCSGFVSMVYQQVFGIRLAESSADIYKEVKPIHKSSLKEGDLVFFKIKKHRISHVGIFLANNKFVHASVRQGVTISDLDEPYYRKYFFKGGRVKN